MRWSFRAGKLLGIQVYVHVTFLLLLGFVLWAHYQSQRSWAAALAGTLFVLAVFGTIVLHELGHATVARRFGIRTRDITLLPIGGVARLERMPDKPRQELAVALAGPAVNVGLALVLAVILVAMGGISLMGFQYFGEADFLVRLMWVNVALALFNLLPAFPMDGGRALRALLAMRLDYVTATQTAAHLGMVMAVLFGMLGLLLNPFLVLIAVFVWVGASAEGSGVELRFALRGLPVSRAMIVSFRTVAPDDELTVAVGHTLAGFQHDFPVLEEGRLVGLLTQTDLLAGLKEEGWSGRVSDVMRRSWPEAEPSEMLETVLPRLEEAGVRTLFVTQAGRLVGMLTTENIGELVMVRSAVRDRRRESERGGEEAPRVVPGGVG